VTNDRAFDLDRLIAEHVDDKDEPSEVIEQAVAVLVDSSIPEDQRASAFVKVMSDLLSQLSIDEFSRFRTLAEVEGQAAAMSYLSSVTRPQQPRQSSR
jgi:hypothetical protein